jgi:hypothetical protein
MKNKILPVLIAAIIIIVPQKAYSQQKASASSANITTAIEQYKAEEDYRVKVLKAYFAKYDSPLVPFAKDFVTEADRYNLDWKLVAAISGTESTFGKAIPFESYNGWGWGVYGDNVIRFSSWSEGIHTISEGLRTKYMDEWGAKDIYEIGHIYASSPVWAQHVEFYMNSIQRFALSDTKNALSLSF